MTSSAWHGGILYALIAKGTFVLAEYEVSADVKTTAVEALPDKSNLFDFDSSSSSDTTKQLSPNYSPPREDFSSMARKILGRIPRSQGIHSYCYGSYMFTYVSAIIIHRHRKFNTRCQFVENDIVLMSVSLVTSGHDIPLSFLVSLSIETMTSFMSD